MKRIALFAIFCISLSACQKDWHCEEPKESCYDASLIDNKILCPQDCPGFLGCDGKTYCNQCIAAQQGIGPMED